jgi:hypothetical protein
MPAGVAARDASLQRNVVVRFQREPAESTLGRRALRTS